MTWRPRHKSRQSPRRGVRARCRDWWQPQAHPVTGDLLKPSERLTWRAVGQYRKWRWFFVLQILTLVWWTHPSWFPGGLPGWNYAWSDLAVVVEQLVGIALFGQMFRDAVVVREELALVREELQEIKAIRQQDSEILFEVHKLVSLSADPHQENEK